MPPRSPQPTAAQIEAFLLVVKHEGIQPAAERERVSISNLSAQVTALEDLLGTRLCVRGRRFRLLRHGQILASACETARELVTQSIRQICHHTRPAVTIAAPEVVTQNYLPDITHQLEQQYPDLLCSTDSGNEEQLRQMLRHGDVDLVIAPEDLRWRGFSSARLTELCMTLICPKKARFVSAAEIWSLGKIGEPCFVSRAADSIVRSFDTHCHRLHFHLESRRFVSSGLVVKQEVAKGHGLGVTVDVPALVRHPNVRVLPLEKFERVPIAAYWRGPATAIIRSAVAALRKVATGIPEFRNP